MVTSSITKQSKSRLFLCAGIAILWLSMIPLTSAQVPATASNGRIAFVSNRDGDTEIFSMNSDGGDVQQLTFNTWHDYAPTWSPDGTHIAFESAVNFGPSELFTINTDGSALQNVTLSQDLSEQMPSWSPDGSQIAFAGWRNNQSNLYILDLVDDSITQITNNSEYNYHFHPTWSPDGTQIAYTVSDTFIERGDISGVFEMRLIDLDSGNQIALLPLNVYGHPDWSWMTNTIVFYDLGLYYTNLVSIQMDVLNPATALEERFFIPQQYPGSDENPSWSPDGTSIVFDSLVYSDTDPSYDYRDIYIMDRDGGNQRNITPNNESIDTDPSWQPVRLIQQPTVTPTETPLATGIFHPPP